MKQLFIFTMLTCNAFASDHGLVKNDTNIPVVINRTVSLQPLVTKHRSSHSDPISIVLQGVRNNELRPQWRQFRFLNNTGTYIPEGRRTAKNIKSMDVTKIYVGVVDLSYKIQPDGSVAFKAGDYDESANTERINYAD